MSTAARIGKPLIIVVVLALVALLVWWFALRSSGEETPSAAGIVEVDEYLVSPAMAGRVQEVHVTEGSEVKADDPVVTLDSQVLGLQLTQAEQAVAAAEAQVTNARDNGTDADVTAARAQVEQAKAAVELIKVQQGYAQVTAPHAGVVTSVTVNAGQNTAPGATLARIIDPNSAYVRAYVPEPYLAQVPVGTAVTVTAVGLGDSSDTAEGKTASADAEAKDATGTYEATAGTKTTPAEATTPAEESGDAQSASPSPSASASRAAETGPGSVTGTVEYVSSQAEFTPNNVQTPEQRADLVYEVRIRLDQAARGAIMPGLPVDVTW